MWISKFSLKSKVLLTLGCILTAIGFAPAPRALASSLLLYSVQEIKPRIFAWVPDDVIDQDCDPLFCRAATAGFIVTSQGVVVIDTANSPMRARDLLYEIRRRTDSPIRYVINTSAAADHMLGNEVFTDEQAVLISTQSAQDQMIQYREELAERMRGETGWKLQARMRGFHVTPSTQTFNDKKVLNIGGVEIRLSTFFTNGTSPEEAVVYLPGSKILFLGELYDNHYFPRVGSRDVHRWIQILREVEGWDVDTYVPGHGAPGSKKDLVDFRKFLEWLVAQVEMRLKQGKTPEDVQKSLWLPKTYNWHASDLATDVVADVCRQLAPPSGAPTSNRSGQ